MKILIKIICTLIAYVGFTNSVYAQPANDNCGAATAISVGVGSCSSTLYTNVAATTVGDPTTPACWSPNSLSHTVWFSFIATTADIEISTNFGGSLANTQLAVYSGSCGSLTQIACQEDVNTAGGLFHTDVILHGLTIGNTYYILVDGNGNTTGTFGVCAQETLPVGPPSPVQDCVTAQTLCNTSNVSVANGVGGVGVNQESPTCFGAPGERSSNWYTFTVATSGTLAFTITPTATIDYDFAVYNTTTSCPGTQLSCNWSPNTGASGTTGLGCAGVQCNSTFTVTAGQTYTILVDRYTSSSSAGFTLNFAGTTATFASPNPTFTATTACEGTATQFTNTTNGNFTYNWNFGDGFTSNLENPSHTYAVAGTYSVTLLLTAVPGGCQNAITQSVTVNPLPTVDAGIGGLVCPGSCITLSGSTNAVGSIGPVSFSNAGTYAIPDGSTTGVYSPIAVSGISPTTITAASIASVCLNMTHTWDSDLDIYLQCPDGTRVELSTDNGIAGINYTNTCFTPTAPTSITTGTDPFTGTWAPEQSFNVLNGCTANGNWQLFVQDDLSGDVGSISGWTITFTNNLPAFTWSPTTGMTNSTTLTPTVCPASTTTYTLTANNGTGCSTTDTVTVNLDTSLVPTFTAVAPICSGGALSALPTTSNNGVTGTWAPALNNTATTTYTFTPTAGQCATTATLAITVTPNTTPTFTAVTPICSGGVLSALPTTSNNGVTGTWAPALNNTTTTTYTFTPTAGQCAVPTTLTITVNPNITPTFTAVAPVCSGGALSALPTTSNNGYTGTWAPTLDNTTTTTYTFTPTAGQCAVPTTLTITVNPNITPTFTAVTPICSGAALSALPTTSNNGYTGTWAPALNNTTTTTYTFTPTAGQCATTTTLTITVNPNITPTFTAVAPICSGAALSALPTTSNNGYTGTWAPALNNTTTTTYTFTPTAGQCATTTTLTITVNPNITPTFTAVAPICSGSALSTLPTTSNNGYTGTWVPALNNTTTTTYTFTPTAGQCATTTTLTIMVNSNITPNFTAVAPICSGAALSALPTTSNNGYTGTWAPVLDNTTTTTYTFTPTAGQCATTTTLTITVNPNITPTFTAVAPICSGAALSALPTTSNNGYTGTWAPALNNTATTTYTFTPTAGQCATTTTLTITVNPNPTISGTLTFCNGSTSQLNGSGTPAAVSPWTSSNTAVATVSNTGLVTGMSNGTSTITYTDSNGCSITATVTIATNILPTFTAVSPICSGGVLSALPTTSNNSITGTWTPTLDNTTTTTYTFTPTAGQCAVPTTLTITVNPNITPTFTALAPICSGAALSALPTTSNNGYTGTWAPALNNTATTTYTFTPTAGQCAVPTTLTIIVNPNPTISGTLTFCNGSTSQLNGSGTPAAVSPWTSSNTAVATVSNTGLVTGVSNGTSTITYTDSNGCSITATVTIATNILPTFTAVSPICSGGVLSALPTTSNNSITGTWAPALDNTTTTTYTFTPTAGQCATTTTLTITVNPNITPSFTAVAPICSGAALSALPTTSNNGYTGTWTPALNNTTTTTYTFTPTAGQCAVPTTLTITVNPNPTISGTLTFCNGTTSQLNGSGTPAAVSPWTSSNTTVATVSNTGLVTGMSNGTSTITYTDINGCSITATVTIATNILPTFTAVSPICSGGVLSALPTTSNNSITGTWTPALDNTTTTTYTFTPTAGQCAVPTTLTITVNPNITPTFTAVTPICSGAALSALPTTSNNGYTGTWAPALNNTTTTTYTFTPTAGQCAVTTTLTITVNPNITPTFTAVAPICSGAALSALPTTSNNGYTGTWAPALNNTTTTTYTFTPTAGQCATTTMLTITVNPNITPTFTAVAPICSGSALSTLPTTSNNGYTGTWTPALDNTTTTTYTFTPTAGQCAVPTTLTITVNPNITPTFTAVVPVCSGAALSALPTTSNNGYTGTWAPALNNTATTTYTFTPTAGQCTVPTTLTITVNPNPTISGILTFCNGSTSQLNGSGTPAAVSPWTSSNTAVATISNTGLVTGASNGTSTITYTDINGCSITVTVTIATNILPTFTAVSPICSGGVLSALPTTSNNSITGTWAPALDNTTTTTYTFTPTAGQCATTTTLTITVNPNITPTFTAVAPICSGAVLSALPTTSNNSITGIWTPALDNTTTTTYTFTPTAGQCAVPTTLTITVNPNITPTFTAVAPICSGSALSTLPTTSNNGYTGTWAPALDNTTTTTYTFTPTAGQCTVPTTLTITVNPNITPTFTAVAPICSGAALSSLPTTSNNGYTGTWAPVLDNTTTTTYTFTPTAGQCAVPTTLTITVNPNITPTFTAVAPICSGATLSALPTTSNNGYTGTWTPALNNTTTTTYTFTPTAGQCATTTTLTITVNPNIAPTFTAVAPICSGGALSALPTSSNNGYTGTWAPALNNTATTTYTFTPTAGQCAVSTTLTITVNPNITPTFTAISPICLGGALSALPTTSNNGYTGTWAPALNNTTTTTYTFTPTVGQCATTTTLTITVNPNITPTFTAVAPICSGATLSALPTTSNNGYTGTWTPALNNTTTTTYTFTPNTGQCAGPTTLTITVNPNIIPTFTAVAPICSGTTLSALPTTSNNGYTGTWAPALNNTTSTIYTFTPTAGQCATTTTLTITVYSLPQVSSLPPLYYCDPNNDGFGVFDLTQIIPMVTGGVPYPVSFHETITDAEINGTFIPDPLTYHNIHSNIQTIYIRVESQESSSCYKIITLDLIVNPTPVAIEPEDYHVCDTNYDGFASFNLASISASVLGAIDTTTHSIAYYTSQANATSATNPISNLTNFINQTINTQTIWIRVENNATGCYDIVTLQLVVDPLPNATQPNYPAYTLCDTTAPLGYEVFDLGSKIVAILLGQTGMNVSFYFSQADALVNSNPLPLLYANVVPSVQTIWIRIENANTGCFVLSTMDIRVEPLPSPIPPNDAYTVCDGNQDGYGSFDLNTLTSDIIQGANYTITYHETIDDAQLGNNPLLSPYENIIPFLQFIYASAVDNNNGCRSVIPIALDVEPQPLMPISIAPLIQCDEDNNPQNQSMLFDLTQVTPIVLAVQSSAPSNYTVTYYTSQTAAIAGIAPIIQATGYMGSNHQIIWVRVENNASECFAIGSFELLVNPPLPITTPAPLSLCDSDANPNNQYTVFDLTIKNAEITQGQPNMTVTYYPNYPVTTSSIAIPNPTTYTNIYPGVQTLGVMVTNPQGCRSYTSLDIRVMPIPTANTTGLRPLTAKCDVNNPGDMLEIFDLTINASLIINGDPTLTLHYYPTQADALAGTNQILNPTNALVGHNVWIRVENTNVDYFGNNCFVLVEQPLTVNPLPTIIQPLTVQNCDTDTDGLALFDLTATTASLLGAGQSASDFTITYYTTAANAQAATNAIQNPSAFTNTINPQIIYIRVVNNTTGCVNYNGQFTLVVNPKPTATAPANFATCDDSSANDGLYPLDLNTYVSGIIGSQTGVAVTFYNSQNDAQNGTNAIADLTNYQAYTHTVWIRVENTTTGCYALTSFNIIVELLAEPVIASTNDTICVAFGSNALLSGLTLNSGVTDPNYTFTWSLNGSIIPGASNATYTITSAAPGDYTVVATSNNPPMLGCASDVSNTFTVIQSGPAQVGNPPYTVSNPFEDNQTITVNILGFGVYEYSLDEGSYQTSNVFENVSLGSHTITIRDVKGNTSCGEIVIDSIMTISYPHYFTPNGDGFHETWNVVGLQNRPARLYIFDRYGKLLKQLSPSGIGWDGTYNGHELPSTDYWFKVEYFDQSQWKEFKAHFSLKR